MPIFKPTYMMKNIFAITPEFLAERGIRCLLLDVDNTLAVYHTDRAVGGVDRWIAEMLAAGVGLYILSNAKPKRLTRFAESVGLDYFYMSMKPLPFKINKAIRKLGCEKSEAALVGDQLFTDILGGNLAGIRTFWLEIIEPESKLSFRIKRRIEKHFRRRYQKN